MQKFFTLKKTSGQSMTRIAMTLFATNTKLKESFLIFGLRFIQKKILNQPLQQEFQNFFLKHCEVHLRTHDLS